MKLKFTIHAQYRIAERNIDVDHIKKVIANPDAKKLDSSGQVKITKKLNSKTIEVVYYKKGFRDRHNLYIIVTAYYLS